MSKEDTEKSRVSDILNRLLEKRWFPVSLKVVTLAAFTGLVIIGFASPTNDPFFVSQLSKTNLTTVFVWRLWWPLIVLSALLFGRIWCMICPVELVTTFFAKYGLKGKRPGWILSGWVVPLFYLVILAGGIIIFQIDLNPGYTSYYLLFIMGISIISGVVFEKNTFCRYICPVGYLLGIFSKAAIWGWRVKKISVCKTCTDKSCINNKYTYQLNYKSCGVDLVPSDIDDNKHCLLCTGCLKTCKTYKSVTNSSRPNPAFTRIGFLNDLLKIKPLLLAEWAFLFILTGSMIFEMTHFQIVTRINNAIFPMNNSGSENFSGQLLNTVNQLVLLPAVLWFFPFLLTRSLRMNITLNDYLKNITIIFLPVIFAFYVGLVIMEVTTRLPYYHLIVHDIKGVETIKSILFRQIEVPVLPQWADLAFFLLMLLSLTAGVLVSFKVTGKLALKLNIRNDKRHFLKFLPPLFTILFLILVLVYFNFN